MLGSEQRLTAFLRRNAAALARFHELILVIQGLRQDELESSPMGGLIEEAAPQARVLAMPEFGIGRSRNLALERAAGEYLWFLDDDVQVEPAAYQHLSEAIAAHPAEIYCAEITNSEDGSPYKDYGPMRDRYCRNPGELLKRSSIEIVADIDFCRRRRIGFNDHIGVGTRYPSGEEALFLLDAFRAGAATYFVAAATVRHPRRSHDLAKIGERNHLMSKGVILRRFGFFYGLGVIADWTRQYAFKGMQPRHLGYLLEGFLKSSRILAGKA
jgi:glycosyltransferase involved in cell wall biosynthesis